ncbi:MAG: rhodanese-like domain-containing protein, partial [Nitrospira sp.]|nr:rhodanese-like domain-containing protein [Nitrospira sp.]
MTPEHLHRLIEARTARMIVDVRTRSEYQSGHVPGAIHSPFAMQW